MKTLLLFLVLSIACSSISCADAVQSKHVSAQSLLPRRPLPGETTAPAMTQFGTDTVWHFGNGANWTSVGYILDAASGFTPGCELMAVRMHYNNYGSYDQMYSETYYTNLSVPPYSGLVGAVYGTGYPFTGEQTIEYAANHVMAAGDQIVIYIYGTGSQHLVYWLDYDYTCP